MKNFVRRSILSMLLLLPFVAQGVMAQFSTGSVVHLVNRSSSKAAAANSVGKVVGVTSDKTDYLQLWYVESGGSTCVLRNLGNGKYLRGTNDSSVQWETVDTKGTTTSKYDGNDDGVSETWTFTTSLKVCSNDGYFTLAAESTSCTNWYYDKLHYDTNTGACVSWLGADGTSGSWVIVNASWWSVETVSGIDVQAQWDKINNLNSVTSMTSTYQGYLNTLFANTQCTQLNSAYQTQAALEASSAYKSLPVELRDMALKVCTGNWAETNRNNSKVSWSSAAAKRFRVQSYEPYSVAEELTSIVKTNAYSNMNNPTGIYADNFDVLYVMVGSTIPTGASLYITSLADDSENYITSFSATSKTQLSQGLNIIPVYGKGNLQYILYGVNSQSDSYPLTNFSPIEIQIAGGSIRGMYELGKDSGIYSELKANAEANDMTYYDVLSEKFAYRTSHGTVFKGGSDGQLQRALKAWDKMMLTQHLVLGIKTGAGDYTDPLNLHTQSVDYSTKMNNRLLVHSKASIYAYTQMPYRVQFAHGESWLVGDAMETTTQLWVPAHETGHVNQTLINMIGTTEISNNLFSNVAMFYQDYLKTRGGSIAENNAEHINGTAWHFRNSNTRMRMFYQLWLYYHAAGRNKNFYPELFRLLRNDPMSFSAGNSAMNYTSTEALKFYKYACQAAKEDLTPFFEAWGFFKPFDKTTINDYYPYNIANTQSDINSAKSAVAGYGYKKNYAILFIEDRIGEVKNTGGVIKGWSDGVVATGDRGQYTDYKTGSSSDPEGEYTWTISQGNRVIVFSKSGKGAGYVISDASGNIIAFANSDNFEVTEAIANGLKSGSYKLTVYGTTVGQSVQAINVENSTSSAAQKIALGVLLENIKAVLDITDATNSKIGYYKSSYATGLQNAYNEAKAVYDNPTPDATAYYAQIRNLNTEYDLLMEKGDYAKVNVVNGSTYKMVNSGEFEDGNQVKVELSMAYNNKDVDGMKTENKDTQRWIFEATGNNGYFYIKNKSSNFYVGKMETNSKQVRVESSDVATAGTYRVVVKAPGLVAFVDENNRALHVDAKHNVVGWNEDATNSQWYMTAVELSDLGKTKDELDALIGETTWAINVMAYATISSTPVVSGIKSEYAGVMVDGVALSTDKIAKACQAVAAAQSVSNNLSATAAEMKAARESLLEHYYYLMGYYNQKNGVNLSAEKTALQTAIDAVQSYLNNMSGGSGESKVELTKDAGQPGYVSSNADQNAGNGTSDGGGIKALLDNNSNTYFHSRWDGAVVNEPHYIQVDLGAGNELANFKFNYTTRNNNSPNPKTIKIYGSTDGTTFDAEPIITLTEADGLPVFYQHNTYNSYTQKFGSTDFCSSGNGLNRYYQTVTLRGDESGNHSVDLDMKSNSQHYAYSDKTSTVWVVEPGETLTPENTPAQSWMHGYVYLDEDNNGFTAGVNGKDPTGDLLSYSFYNNYSYNGATGVATGTSDNTKTYAPPFKAPEKMGLYRLRFKTDWNSIDPAGDSDLNSNGGYILDVTLSVGDKNQVYSYESPSISCGKYCRALRFVVTESVGQGNTYNNQYNFALSGFGLTRIDDNSTEDTWVSEELKRSAQNEINDAQNVHDNAKTAIELVRETEAMEALLASLKSAQQLTLPVKLTTNPDTPYLYQVEVKTVNNQSGQVWQYDTTASTYSNYAEARNYISYAASESSNTNQAWYFMKGTETGQVYIYPYNAGGKLLAVDQTMYNLGTNGRIYSYAKDDIDNYVQEWTFVDCGDGTFNVRPAASGTGYYVAMAAQLGSVYKLGFKNNGNDANTKFIFNAVKPAASEAWNNLNNYVNKYPEVPGSTQLFATSVASANAYNTLRREAVALLETSAADDVLTEMYNRLKAAYEAISINEPNSEKLYFIRSAYSNASMKDAYTYNDNGTLKWTTSYNPETQTSGIWQITAKGGNQYVIQSYDDATKHWPNYSMSTTGIALSKGEDQLTILPIDGSNGQVNIYYNDGSYGYAAYNVVSGNNLQQIANTKGTANNAAAFYIEEVPHLEELKSYDLKMTHWGYAGLYLDFTTEIPEALTAYVITNNEPEDVTTDDAGNPVGTIVLRELDGANRVLPANTGVILKAKQKIEEGATMLCSFAPTEKTFDGNEALVSENKLDGSVEETYVRNWPEGGDYTTYNSYDFYLFGVKNGKIGLYKAQEKYQYADGTVDNNWEYNDLHNKYNNYIKVSANKIYLRTANGALKNASSSSRLKFRIADPDDEFVTDIEEVQTETETKPEAIFDLQGRRIERITAPGLYIVNGQKRYVKAVKF